MTALMVEGKNVSIAREQIDGVTRQMEDLVEIAGEQAADHLRPFVKFCVFFLNTIAKASALLPKSSPDERSQCVTGLKWILKNWPLAELAESQMSGLDSQDLKDVVNGAMLGIEQGMDESMQSSLTNVAKQLKACAKLLRNIDVAKEAAFREQMALVAPKIATALQKMKKASDPVKLAYANQGLSFDEANGELAAEIAETDAMGMYHITVYAALTLYRDSQTWSSSQPGKKALANLKTAMNALDNSGEGVTRLEIKYNHTVVSEMRVDLLMPRPSIASMGSAHKVSTSSEAQGSAQLVSTSSEARGSDQLEATSSEGPGSAQLVSMTSEAPVSEQLVSRSSEATDTGEAVSAGSGTQVSDQCTDQTVAAALVSELTTDAKVKRGAKRAKGKEEGKDAAPRPKKAKSKVEGEKVAAPPRARITGKKTNAAASVEAPPVPHVEEVPPEWTAMDATAIHEREENGGEVEQAHVSDDVNEANLCDLGPEELEQAAVKLELELVRRDGAGMYDESLTIEEG
jgi:hypothetical protein